MTMIASSLLTHLFVASATAMNSAGATSLRAQSLTSPRGGSFFGPQRALQSCSNVPQLGSDVRGVRDGDQMGGAVALSSNGTLMAVGSHLNTGSDGNSAVTGLVKVFALSEANEWTQVGQDIYGTAVGDQSGYSVSLSADGTVLANGAIGQPSSSGEVRVFLYDNGSRKWNQTASVLHGRGKADDFGTSVDLSADGTILAVGANQPFTGNPGYVQAFRFDTKTNDWKQLGSDIIGKVGNDQFGAEVSLSADGTTLAVGAFFHDVNDANSGQVQVFRYVDGSGWSKRGQDLNGEAADDLFGYSVSLSSDGSILAVGAKRSDANGVDSGLVQVFQYRDALGWIRRGQVLAGSAAGDQFGWSVALSSNGFILAAGARLGNANDSGHVRLFAYTSAPNNDWVQIAGDLDGSERGDNFGNSVAISSDGSIVAASGIQFDGDGAGYVRAFEIPALCFPSPAPTQPPDDLPTVPPTPLQTSLPTMTVEPSEPSPTSRTELVHSVFPGVQTLVMVVVTFFFVL